MVTRMTTLLLVVAMMLFGKTAISQDQWERATNTGQKPTGDAMITSCNYQTLGGFRFSMTFHDLCPLSVDVNPETGKVRTRQLGYPNSSERWESATNEAQEPTGDAMVTRCVYQTLRGYRFSVDQHGICSVTVEVNPETGSVKTPLSGYGTSFNSGDRWESATNMGQESTGDGMLTRCTYQTLGGYNFSTNVRGVCPITVKVNPETRQVRE
jgi:hypothetical protein